MFFIEKTTEFDKWLRKLNDLKAKAKILFRIQKLRTMNILEIANQLMTESKKCESILLKVIEFTSRKKTEDYYSFSRW